MTIDLSQAYHLLGLPMGAAPDEVKAAYRDLAQVWHPDRFESNERLREKAAQNLQRINEAYAVLGGRATNEDAVAMPPPLTLGERISAAFGIRDLGRTGVADRLEVVLPSSTYGRRRSRHRGRRRRRAWLMVGALVLVLFTALLASLARWVW